MSAILPLHSFSTANPDLSLQSRDSNFEETNIAAQPHIDAEFFTQLDFNHESSTSRSLASGHSISNSALDAFENGGHISLELGPSFIARESELATGQLQFLGKLPAE